MQELVKVESGPVAEVGHHSDNDRQVIAMWLYGRPTATQRAYFYEVEGFMGAIRKPLASVTLGDLQWYFSTKASLSAPTQARAINVIKSLFSFAMKTGYLSFNPAVPLMIPKSKNTLAERILSEAQVHSMIALEPSKRNRVLLLLAYASGVRVSEACGLKWKDTREREGAGQVTVYGKGGRTRAGLPSVATWKELRALRGQASSDDPIFASRQGGGHLDPSMVMRIVRAAGARAGIPATVSPHWLRHAHASHALDRGCPIHLVQATLGHASVATTGQYLHARPDDSSARYLGV